MKLIDELMPHDKTCANKNCAGARRQGYASRNSGDAGLNEAGRCCARPSTRTRPGPSSTGTTTRERATSQGVTIQNFPHVFSTATALPPPTSSSRQTWATYIAISIAKLVIRPLSNVPKILELGLPRPRLHATDGERPRLHTTGERDPKDPVHKKTKEGPM